MIGENLMEVLINIVVGLVLGWLVVTFVRALVKPFPRGKDDDKN